MEGQRKGGTEQVIEEAVNNNNVWRPLYSAGNQRCDFDLQVDEVL